LKHKGHSPDPCLPSSEDYRCVYRLLADAHSFSICTPQTHIFASPMQCDCKCDPKEQK
jgi:hypothetical protein